MGQLLRARRKPSGAMLVAIVALVVAASGTAVAASKLVRGDSLIKRNSLSGNRLKNRSVTGAKIKLSSLGTVPSASHATTADSATNATTATTAGSAPIAKLTYVATPFSVPDDATFNTDSAACPAGANVTGGGASIADTLNGVVVMSYPDGKTGWTAVFQDFGSMGTPTTGTVYAICAPAASTSP